MDFFWIYEIPFWYAFSIVVGSFSLFSILGIFLLRPFISKWWSGHDNNDQIAFYLSAIGVFYGITLGLLAAGVWQNYEDADEKVTNEASAIAALYRDIRSFPSPYADSLKVNLENYTRYVFTDAWALHRKGITQTDGTRLLTLFEKHLYYFEPKTEREIGIYHEALKQYNRLIELRRQRLSSVSSGMPFTVWLMIFIGALITLATCWLFHIPSLRLHIILNSLIGVAIGVLIFLIIMLDYPFRGDMSVSSDAYEQVYYQLMKPLK